MITEADRIEAEKILLTVDGRGQTAKREALKLLLENEREMVMSRLGVELKTAIRERNEAVEMLEHVANDRDRIARERNEALEQITNDRNLIATNVIKLEAAIKDLAIDIHNGIIRK